MAQAIVVTLEKELSAAPTVVKGASGKALAREAERLDFAARCKNVPALTSLMSESPSALAEQLNADGFDPRRCVCRRSSGSIRAVQCTTYDGPGAAKMLRPFQ